MRINYADSIEGKAEKSQLYSLKKEQEGKPLLQLELTDVERKRNRERGGGDGGNLKLYASKGKIHHTKLIW